MAYNSLLPAELQPVYQQHFGEGDGGAVSYVSPLDPLTASQISYHHEGVIPSPEFYTSSPDFAGGQPVIGHYNPQPFAPNVYHPMVRAGIPPPYKPMAVLPAVHNPSVRIESSPAVLSGGSYGIDGTLEYGEFVPFGTPYNQLPLHLTRELKESYGMYPRTDIKIVVENGRYQLYATPFGRGGDVVSRALPPIVPSRFHHHLPLRHSVAEPRPVFHRQLHGLSGELSPIDFPTARHFPRVYRSHSPVLSPLRVSPSPPLRLSPLPLRDSMMYRRSPLPFLDSEILEVPLTPPPPRSYAKYIRSTNINPRRISRYRSPTRYTERNIRRSYIDSDARLDVVRNLFHP